MAIAGFKFINPYFYFPFLADLVPSNINNLRNSSFYFFYPTLPLYPNNKKEANVVAEYSNNRPKYYENFFYLTDDSVSHAFVNLVDEIDNLEKLSSNWIESQKILN